MKKLMVVFILGFMAATAGADPTLINWCVDKDKLSDDANCAEANKTCEAKYGGGGATGTAPAIYACMTKYFKGNLSPAPNCSGSVPYNSKLYGPNCEAAAKAYPDCAITAKDDPSLSKCIMEKRISQQPSQSTSRSNRHARWEKGSISKTALVAGTSAGKPLHICRAVAGNGVVGLGKVWNNTCYVEYQKTEVKLALLNVEVFNVADPAAWVWIPITPTSTVPSTTLILNPQSQPNAAETPIAMGAPANSAIFVCRGAMPNKEVHVGRGQGKTCNVGFGGQAIHLTVFEALTVTGQ